ncbi:hypothetical protein N802_04070 [Knoellia sinensis KCTC 19936]|uniref:Uncharacterized protein n=1 Tax=Knoellia sinensis KCTC 19936 TaxID=1385520 RepID=A0A0A0J1G7_9MICO|nr:hypothetical protein N802_04070 [Knoellia sinensis KCTC 19936]
MVGAFDLPHPDAQELRCPQHRRVHPSICRGSNHDGSGCSEPSGRLEALVPTVTVHHDRFDLAGPLQQPDDVHAVIAGPATSRGPSQVVPVLGVQRCGGHRPPLRKGEEQV